jgi:hypothetical protein
MGRDRAGDHGTGALRRADREHFGPTLVVVI